MSEATAIEQPAVEFFLALQRAVNARDAGAIARAFAPEVLLADPAGTHACRNDEELRAFIDSRLALLEATSARDVKALQIDQAPMGAPFVLVTVRWSVWFMPAEKPDFVDEFLVDYVVRIDGDTFTIAAEFAYDDEAELRRRMHGAG